MSWTAHTSTTGQRAQAQTVRVRQEKRVALFQIYPCNRCNAVMHIFHEILVSCDDGAFSSHTGVTLKGGKRREQEELAV